MTIFLRMPEHGRPLQPVQSLPWSTSRPISVSEPPVFITWRMAGGGGISVYRPGDCGGGGGRAEDFDHVSINLPDPTFRLCNIHAVSLSFARQYTRTLY